MNTITNTPDQDTPSLQRWRGARLIWAIAAKDVADGFKSKTILTIVLTVLFIIALYKLTPMATGLLGAPYVWMYDAGDSALGAMLENSRNIDVRRFHSQSEMEQYLTRGGEPELGLVIPAGFDNVLATAGQPQLDGYVAHWVSPSQAEGLKVLVEGEITALAGKPVSINLEGHRVYPPPDAPSFGVGMWACMTLVFVLITIGLNLVPTMMVEEKQTRTLEALLVSPAGHWHVTIGKAVAGLVYSLAGIAVIFAFNANLVTQWGFALLAALSGAMLMIPAGLLMGTFFEVKQAMAVWLNVLMVALIVPVPISGMAMDLPAMVNNALRWYPTVALSRLFQMSMSNQAPFAEWGLDLALVLGPALVLLAAVAWRLQRVNQ